MQASEFSFKNLRGSYHNFGHRSVANSKNGVLFHKLHISRKESSQLRGRINQNLSDRIPQLCELQFYKCCGKSFQ